jgi:anti-sigma factor RsiW
MMCERVLEQLSDYLDGELSPAAMAGIRSHLRRCPDCEQEHEALRRTVQLLALHGRQTVPVDCREHVLARLRSNGDDRRPVATGSLLPTAVEGLRSAVEQWLTGGDRSPALRRPLWAGALATAAVAFAGIGGAFYLARAPQATSAPPVMAHASARPAVTVGMTQEDFSRLHGSFQFGQALGPDDGIILASDLVESP